MIKGREGLIYREGCGINRGDFLEGVGVAVSATLSMCNVVVVILL